MPWAGRLTVIGDDVDVKVDPLFAILGFLLGYGPSHTQDVVLLIDRSILTSDFVDTCLIADPGV